MKTPLEIIQSEKYSSRFKLLNSIDKNRVIAAMEEYANQFKPATDTEEFIKFAKDERVKFSMDFGEKFFELKPKNRVVVENLLISYDQLVERLENQTK